MVEKGLLKQLFTRSNAKLAALMVVGGIALIFILSAFNLPDFVSFIGACVGGSISIAGTRMINDEVNNLRKESAEGRKKKK